MVQSSEMVEVLSDPPAELRIEGLLLCAFTKVIEHKNANAQNDVFLIKNIEFMIIQDIKKKR
uniref:Uncharacterized protein n=1 Tax=uncultured bacterium BLR12 TaxID=506514 RepID=C0INE2_9BACT|nr:hypothetical protein AKSOIL_0213 [uncultured bacterium BLR12]